MNKLTLLYRTGMYETLLLTNHTITFRERYNMTMLQHLYDHVKEVLNKQ